MFEHNKSEKKKKREKKQLVLKRFIFTLKKLFIAENTANKRELYAA